MKVNIGQLKVSKLEPFHDLLFEISNEYRHGILLLVENKPMRVTDMTKELKLTYPEIRRHITRLQDVGVIQRNLEGYYYLTPFGISSLFLLEELKFLTLNREYFRNHELIHIISSHVKQIGKLIESTIISNPIDFFHHTENLLKKSTEYVWLLVDQFPMNLLSNISKLLDRGVRLRIIEPTERVLNHDLEAITSEEASSDPDPRLADLSTKVFPKKLIPRTGIAILAKIVTKIRDAKK